MGYSGQEKFYKVYSEKNWIDTHGNLVEDWMERARNKWFTEESKINNTSLQKSYR